MVHDIYMDHNPSNILLKYLQETPKLVPGFESLTIGTLLNSTPKYQLTGHLNINFTE